MNPSKTVGVILAAGVGSRLRPYTDDKPKCLVPIGDETILHRAVRLLAASGISRLILSTGYRESSIRDALRDAPVRISYVSNHDYASTQNMVSLTRALKEIASDESVVKLDGDVLFTQPLIARMLHSSSPSLVAVERSATLGAEEMKVRVEAGRVLRFGKGLEPASAHGESIGIERFDAKSAAILASALQRAVEAGRTDVYYEDVYNDVIDRIEMRTCDVATDEWMEVDDADDLARACARFASERP